MVSTVAGIAALVLALIHYVAGKLRFLHVTPRSVWLSLAGGVSVAYVFLHLLPELSEAQETLAESAGEALSFLEAHSYLVALVGLAVFYGIDRAAILSRRQNRTDEGKDGTSGGVFWLHIASFAIYNVLVGYLLLHRETEEIRSLVVFAFAMALHFVVNDYGLREHHKEAYDRIGRWILAVAVLGGWTLGLVIELSEAMIALLIAFLAGGIILNVLKEELPEERESRFWAFALGATVYGALLLSV
jgi:zinc transporter ZupT